MSSTPSALDAPTEKDLVLESKVLGIVRFHFTWFSETGLHTGIQCHSWKSYRGSGYYMYLGTRGQLKPLTKNQEQWIMELMKQVDAKDVSVFRLHRDRVDPLPIREPVYLYPRL